LIDAGYQVTIERSSQSIFDGEFFPLSLLLPPLENTGALIIEQWANESYQNTDEEFAKVCILTKHPTSTFINTRRIIGRCASRC
jgi:hypothetical protein